MKTSKENQRTKRSIAIIIVAVSALFAAAFFMFSPRNKSKPNETIIPKKDTILEGTAVMNKPLISEDPTNREELKKRKDSIWWKTERGGERDKGYEEQERFAKVLQQASDKELFAVLKYAIAHRYVPNRDIDPYSSMYVLVGRWQRSLMVYDKLSGRKDLLRKIYPNLKALDDYLRWNGNGRPYPDTIVSQTIMDNVGKGSQELDSIVGTIFDKSSLAYKYFGTPLMGDE